MTYTIIERRPDGATTDVELDGRTYPVPCIVADDDDLHLLLIEGMHLSASVWHWALGAGVTAVISTDNQTFALTSTFSDERTENARMGSYVLAETYWLPYTPGMGYLAMVGLALPGPEALADVERVAAEKLAATRPEGFVHLHTHSECSALDGLSTMKEIVAEVKAQGNPAVAVTDHGNCAAHPALALECAKAGIKPIFGMEAYFYEDRTLRGPEHRYAYQHLVLWAMNDVGLHNLWAISTESFATGLYDKKARVDWDLLERFGEGIMCSTACLRGPLAYPFLNDEEHGEETALHNLARLKRIFGDRLYIELHTNQLPEQIKVNNWLVELAHRHKVPMVAVVDSHYAHAEHKHDHRVWLSVQTDSDAADDSSLFGGDQDYHLMTQDEVEKSLSYLDSEVVAKAVANTVRVADRCTAELTGKSHNPVFSRPHKDWASPIEHDIDRLFTLCMENWDARTKGKTHSQKVYLERFEREIGMIIAKGFPGYFLMVADFVNWAKKHKIFVGPSRGSGGGSLVAYVMRITEIDPVEADLLFERFMTEGRTALPDFDIDFPSSKKQVMLGYVGERWGIDHIATVGTHMRLKSKGIINDVARAIKSTLPEDYYVDTKACSAIIKEAEAGTAGLGLSWEDLWDEHGEVLDPFRERYPELFGYCDKLHGRLKSFGTHPAGVIIDPDNPLSGALPLRNGENGMVTQWDMEALEALGFVKFDMLNLRTLDTLQNTLDLIEKTTGRWIDVYGWRDEYEDPQIYEQISEGWTLGIFQIETTSGTQMVRRFRPETLAELADVITLVRPGPVRSGLTETYFRRRIGEEEVYVPDVRLEPVLAKTYGCFSAETRIVTREGTREIGQLAGGHHELMTTKGVWTKAEVRSFGVQPLRRVRLCRNQQTKVIYSTGNHRWFAGWNGTKDRDRELLTDELRPGMSLTAQMPWRPRRLGMSPFGVAAGVTFGDGTATPHQAHVDLHGEKNAELLRFFNGARTRHNRDQDRYSEPYITVLDLPRSWKQLPSLDEGPSFLHGWLAGYFAADGCVAEDGRPTMSSASREALEHFRTVANLVGIGTYDIVERENTVPTPQGGLVFRKIHTMGLVSGTLTEEFFVLSEHRRRFFAAQERRQRADRVRWTVEAVEDTDRVEEVFCAVVPETHAFVLEDNILTGNCMVYQEDIMAVTMVLAGYDSNEADTVRRILGKKKVEAVLAEGEKFVHRSVSEGVEVEVATDLWEQMAEFAKYSFNRAHAFAYATLGLWTAWLKFHYPVQFLTAALSTVKPERIPEFVEEARRMGYAILPPDINDSGMDFAATSTAVRYGLLAIKGVGEVAVNAILAHRAERRFDSFTDFMDRVVEPKGSKCNKGVVKKLIHIGAFDSLEPNRRGLELHLEALEFVNSGTDSCEFKTETFQPIFWTETKAEEVTEHETTLPCSFDWPSEPDILGRTQKPIKRKAPPKKCTRGCRQFKPAEPIGVGDVEPYTPEEIGNIEVESLGVFLSWTPFHRIPDEVRGELSTATEILTGDPGIYLVGGWIQGIRMKAGGDRYGRAMGWMSVMTERGEMDITVFSKAYEKYRKGIKPNTLALMAVEKNSRGQTLHSLESAD